MDPFAKLEKDHDEVAAMLTRLEQASDRAEKTREQVCADLDQALSLHAKIEEEVVYPVLERLKQTHEVALESIEEHKVIKQLLKELVALPEEGDEWKAKLKVLREAVEHHVDEEEGTTFPQAREALDDGQKRQIERDIGKMAAAGA